MTGNVIIVYLPQKCFLFSHCFTALLPNEKFSINFSNPKLFHQTISASTATVFCLFSWGSGEDFGVRKVKKKKILCISGPVTFAELPMPFFFYFVKNKQTNKKETPPVIRRSYFSRRYEREKKNDTEFFLSLSGVQLQWTLVNLLGSFLHSLKRQTP